MDDKLTRKSQDALSTAVRRAAADGSPQVDPLHLLLAPVEQADGTTTALLRAVGADPALVARQAEKRLARMPRARGATLSAPDISRPLRARHQVPDIGSAAGGTHRTRTSPSPTTGSARSRSSSTSAEPYRS